MGCAAGSCPAARPPWRSWTAWRRCVQLATLAGFLLLAWATAASAARGWRPPPLADLVFLLDPLVLAAALAAGTAGLALLLAGGAAFAASLVLGRAFCGWLCPLGTLLDIARRLTRPFAWRVQHRTSHLARPAAAWQRRGPQVVLIVVVAAMLAGLPLVGWVDPFAILTRALACAVLPWLDHAAGTVAGWFRPAIDHIPAPGLIDDYRFIGAPVRQAAAHYPLAIFSAVWLGLLLAAEIVQPRFWCRSLCPTGAALGLLARWSLVRRLPARSCTGCSACTVTCQLGAFDGAGAVVPAACTACMSCVERCPQADAAAVPAPPTPQAQDHGLSRRGFLAACAAGAAAPLALGRARAGDAEAPPPFRLRPPGVAEAGSDGDFLIACVRCGECMRACPTHGLQPVLRGDGLAGAFAPRLVPRLGPCEHGCTACAAVCPSGAIPLLDLATKKKARLGLAIHDHHRCLPWSGGGECRVCWEHCPVEGRAITLKMAFAPNGQAIPLPGVDAERCIGCGTCEFVCPIEGEAGIRVVARAAQEAMTRRLQPPPTPA